VTTLFIGTVEY